MNKENYFAALYVSEGWYSEWKYGRCGIHGKARAVVLFDRVLNGRLVGTVPKAKEETT